MDTFFLQLFKTTTKFILFILLLFFESCNTKEKALKSENIVIQPFDNIDVDEVLLIKKKLTPFFTNIYINPTIQLPKSAFYIPRDRYRADSLIHFLSQKINSENTKILGVTNQDISTTKSNIKDWGIIGLSYQPGKASIISTYRLNKERIDSQLYKIALHELGHAYGLDHCSEKACLMRDAEGHNVTDQIHTFCPTCKKYLLRKGWNL